jgi:hypothetical protein
MSLNKVLNRPMFRQKALKKGDLKPVHAQMGTMVGSPGPTITGVVNPNRLPSTVVKPQGFFQKLGSEFRTSRQGIQQIMNPKSPQFTAKGTFGSGRLLPGLLGVEGVYSVVDPVVGQYMKPGIARDLVSYGISGAATLNPYVRAAGLAKFGYDTLDKYAFKPLAAGVKAYRSTPVSERKVLPDVSGEASIGNFPEPATNEEIKEEVKVTSKAKPGSGRPGFSDRLTEQDNESDVVKGNVDINKVVKNNDPNQSPVTIGAEDTVAEKGFKEKPKTDTETKVTDNKANANLVKSDSNQLDKKTAGEIKAGDGTEVNSEVIELARKYRKELMAGQGSQAKTVFLANLASGLLSGTTTKGGIGGALEVFGKALGPAVNNYATVKLKENEMENEFMSDALELAQDEIAAQNDLVEGTSGLDFESYGYIQFRDRDGNAVNRQGGRLKDGTYVQAALGQVDANGRQLYVPVAAGTFSDYFTDAFGKKEQAQTIRNLSGKYKALGIGKETIKILEDAAAKGETLGGPVGRFNLLTTRLGDALNDIGFSMFESKDAGMAKVNQMREDFKQELIDDGMSDKDAEKFLNDNFGSIESQFKKTLKDLGVFKDETTAANLERLAINETVLTYALANSLKDKDRLTQKDIQMAQQLVNVFPLLRGQKQVVRSLEAVNERILGDIKASELNYTEFGGNTATLENFRRKYGLLPEIKDQQLDVGFQNESTIDLLEKLGQI